MSIHEAAFDVEGKSVVVTGASQGIGKAVAETLAAGGADVAICSRAQERVDPVAERIEAETDARCLAIECNVRERDAVESFFERVAAEFGGVDALVNNAGGEFVAPFEDISENGWNAIVDLNLNGTFHCTQVAGEYMREHGESGSARGGVIVNMASVNGQHAAPNESHYSASKAAIIRLTETLSVEWARHGIRVVCVAPGLVQTPGVTETLGIDSEAMPSREEVDRRIGHPEDIADVVQFLVSPAAAFVNGETLTAKGVPRAGNAMNVDLGLDR
jgi:NAD(P)-dependent dehydrogenase (short-subunit alcohol dehydrogenase family)